MSALSKNRFTFDVLKQLPFECDSRLEQLSKLDFILSKLYIALTACNWVHILKWDNELDKWLQLGYRLPRKTHTTLVSIYYELAMSMNLTQLVDKHASARFRQLLDLPSCPDESCQGNVCTHCIDKRYLTVADLQLDWRLAFALLKKYFYPNQHYQSPVLPRFTCDAELIRAANAFFPAEETENVLNEVLPLFSLSHCEDTYIAIGMLSLLVPASPSSSDDFDLNPQTWLPTIFHLYNMLKKGDVCGTLLFDMFSRLAVGGLSDKYKYQFSEYGVFTQKQARTLFHYGLQLLHLSVRNGLSFTENTQSFAMEVAFDARGATVVSHLARWIVCSLSVKCEEAEDSILTLLDELFSLISQYFYPSVDGSNNIYLYQFLQELAYCFLERWTYENDEKVSIPKERRLTKSTKEKFVGILKPSMLYAIYSSAPYLSEMAQGALRALSILEPDVIVPCMLKRIYPALQSSLETHQTLISLESLITLAPIIAESKRYRPHIISLMELQLPGIDPNDSQKTRLVLHFVAVIAQCVSFCKIDENVDPNIFLQWLQMEIRNLDHTDYDNLTSKGDETVIDYDEIMSSAMNSFPEWMIRFEDRVFTLLENFPDGKDKKLIESYLLMALESLLKSMSDEWFNLALSRAANFVSTNVIHQSMDAVKGVCMAFSCVAPEKTWSALYPVISANIFFEIDENKAGLSRGTNADAILPRDRTLVWNLNILNTIIGSNATYFLRKEEELITLLDKLLRCRGFVSTLASSCMSQLVTRLISVFPTYSLKTQHLTTDEWGKPCKEGSFHMCWNIPFEQEIDLVVKVCNRYMMLCMDRLQHLIIDRKLTNATIEWVDEVNSYLERLGFMCSASAELFRIPDQEFVPESEYDEDNMYTADFEYVRSKSHCRWAITTQHRSIMDALRERLGSLLIELHRIMFDSVDSDVSILKNLVICENKFLSDYDYPVSLLSGRDYSNYLNPTLRYTNLLKFFDFVPQKQPYSAMLLSHNIYVNYQNHMCRSFLSRIPTSNERILIHNLTVPCCSQYEDIRRTACSALTDCVPFFRRIRLPVLQSLIGILKDSKDVNVLQGAFEAIFFNPFLMNLVHRHWVFLSPFLFILIRLWSLDEPILRTIASDVFEYDMTTTVCYETYFPVYKHLYVPKVSSQSETERLRLLVAATEQQRQRDREAALKTRDEFVDLFPNAHWKLKKWITTIFCSFANLFVPPVSETLKLMSDGLTASHYINRMKSVDGLFEILLYIWEIALSKGNTDDILCQTLRLPNELKLERTPENKKVFNQALFDFKKRDKIFCVQYTFPGWFVLPNAFNSLRREYDKKMDFSAVQVLVDTVVEIIDENWFQKVSTYFAEGFSEEGEDDEEESSSYSVDTENWQLKVVYFWESIFKLLFNVDSNVSASFLHKHIDTLCSSSDCFVNRSGIELLTGVILSLPWCNEEVAQKHWEWVVSVVDNSLQTNLLPENFEYWSQLILTIFTDRDPALYWPLYDKLVSIYRTISFSHICLDTAKLELLARLFKALGWHFQNTEPVYKFLLSNLQQPYKKYREVIGTTLAETELVHVHESFDSVGALIKANLTAGSLGSFFEDSPSMKVDTLVTAYEKLELLRLEAKTDSDCKSYAYYASTMTHWTESLLLHPSGFVVLSVVPDTVLPAVIHMLDVKDEDDLQQTASFLLKLLGSLIYPLSTVDKFCYSCIAIMKNPDSWHHRLHILTILPPFMFQHSLIISKETKLSVLEMLIIILDETKPEVQESAAISIAMLIQCFTHSRLDVILNLREQFLKVLDITPSLKSVVESSLSECEYCQLVAQRHAAVLGLSALVNSNAVDLPPKWMKPVLLRLVEITNDLQPLATVAKKTIANFKKSHSDVWQLMLGYFTSEELIELNSVSSHSYFA